MRACTAVWSRAAVALAAFIRCSHAARMGCAAGGTPWLGGGFALASSLQAPRRPHARPGSQREGVSAAAADPPFTLGPVAYAIRCTCALRFVSVSSSAVTNCCAAGVTGPAGAVAAATGAAFSIAAAAAMVSALALPRRPPERNRYKTIRVKMVPPNRIVPPEPRWCPAIDAVPRRPRMPTTTDALHLQHASCSTRRIAPRPVCTVRGGARASGRSIALQPVRPYSLGRC